MSGCFSGSCLTNKAMDLTSVHPRATALLTWNAQIQPEPQSNSSCHGNWTTRGYANSRIANSRTGHLADWSTSRLDNSQTRQLVDWTSRGLDNSRMSPVVVAVLSR